MKSNRLALWALVAVAALLLPHTGWAQGLSPDFPMLSSDPDMVENIKLAFGVQWAIFNANGLGGSAIFYLSIAAMVVAISLIIFDKKYQSFKVLIPWFYICLATVFAAYNSKFIFYPLSGVGTDVKAFTPQLVATHLASTLTFVVDQATKGLPNIVDEAKRQQAFQNTMKNFDLPQGAKDVYNEFKNKCPQASAPGSIPSSSSVPTGSGSANTINDAKNDIAAFYSSSGERPAAGSAYSGPMIGLFNGLPYPSEDLTNAANAAYVRNIKRLGGSLGVDVSALNSADNSGAYNSALQSIVPNVVATMRNDAEYKTDWPSPASAAWHVVLVDSDGRVISSENSNPKSPIFLRNKFLQEDVAQCKSMGGAVAPANDPITGKCLQNTGSRVIEDAQEDITKGIAGLSQMMEMIGDGKNMPVANVSVTPKGTIDAPVLDIAGSKITDCVDKSNLAFPAAINQAFPFLKEEAKNWIITGDPSSLSCLATRCTPGDLCSGAPGAEKCGTEPYQQELIESIVNLQGGNGDLGAGVRKALQDKLESSTNAPQTTSPEMTQGPDMTGRENSQGWLSRLAGAVGLNFIASEIGNLAVGVLGQLIGWLAGIFLNVVQALISIAISGLIIVTPLIFLMGILIPTNAAGMLFYTTVGIFVLTLVPMTTTLVDKLTGVMLKAVAGEASLTMTAEQFGASGYILIAASFMYLGIIGLTFMILFKLGDANNITKLMAIDGAAKKVAEVGRNITLGLLAGGAATGIGAYKTYKAGKKAADAAGGIPPTSTPGTDPQNPNGQGGAPVADGTPEQLMEGLKADGVTALEGEEVLPSMEAGDFIGDTDTPSPKQMTGGILTSIPIPNDADTQMGDPGSSGQMTASGSGTEPTGRPVFGPNNELSIDGQDVGVFNPADGKVTKNGEVVGTYARGVFTANDTTGAQLDADIATADAEFKEQKIDARVNGADPATVGGIQDVRIVDDTTNNKLPSQAPEATKTSSSTIQDQTVQKQTTGAAQTLSGTGGGGNGQPPAGTTPPAASSPAPEPAKAADAGKGADPREDEVNKRMREMSGWQRAGLGAKAGLAGYMEAAGGWKNIPIVGKFIEEFTNEGKEAPLRARAMLLAQMKDKEGRGAWGAYSRLQSDAKSNSLLGKFNSPFSGAAQYRGMQETGNLTAGMDNAYSSGQQSAAGVIAEYEGRRQANERRAADNRGPMEMQDYFRTQVLSSISKSMDISQASIFIKDGKYTMQDGQNITTLQRFGQMAHENAVFGAGVMSADPLAKYLMQRKFRQKVGGLTEDGKLDDDTFTTRLSDYKEPVSRKGLKPTDKVAGF